MKNTDPERRLWTLQDMARFMGCTTRHIQNLMVAGLPYLKLGRLVRFDPEEVRRYVFKTRKMTVG